MDFKKFTTPSVSSNKIKEIKSPIVDRKNGSNHSTPERSVLTFDLNDNLGEDMDLFKSTPMTPKILNLQECTQKIFFFSFFLY